MPNTALQAMLARDASVFVHDFGVTVTFGAETATGVIDTRDEAVEAGGSFVTQRRRVLRLVTGTLALVDGSLVTIGGVTHRVDGDGVPVAPDGAHTDYTVVGAP